MSTEHVPIGTFEVSSGMMVCSDPCYQRGCRGSLLLPAANGTWEALVEWVDGGTWGDRISRLTVRLVGGPTDLQWGEGSVGVDSGQFGFFDSGAYAPPNDSSTEFDDPETFYGRVCALTCGEEGCGVIPSGAVSRSGYGDGGYTVETRSRSADGVLIEATAVFIDPDCDDDEDGR